MSCCPCARTAPLRTSTTSSLASAGAGDRTSGPGASSLGSDARRGLEDHPTPALRPLHALIEAHVLSAERLHGDDTTVPILAKGRTKTGRVWVYVRDDRPFGGTDPPAALFYASRDRTGVPATEPVPIEPIRVDGMAYAKIIAGMMNVGYFRERPTADGGSERVIVAKLVFPGDPSTVNRAIIVTQAGLDGAMREQVEREQAERRARPKPRITPMRASASSRGALRE